MNTAPTTANTPTLFPAEQYSYCDSSGAKIKPIMPLSYDWTTLKTKIDALVPTGNTNQGIGLAWGWMTLTQSDPFNAPAKDPNFVYKDAIVILSDGLNTQNRWYTNANSIDARQRILCDNAKAASITIYTVQVNTGGDPTSSVLQYCAQNTSQLLPGHLGLADGLGVQRDRHPALQAARFEISARHSTRNKKARPCGRAFSFGNLRD